MPSTYLAGRLMDVRPDRIDLRDRPYQPSLVNLPPQYPLDKHITTYLPAYETAGLIRNQGSEGACTGFGLSAVVNYLAWYVEFVEKDEAPVDIERVSPRMLYELARLYDEWDGEDYEGSSCRGAMKGWHKHGVCSETLWPYKPTQFISPKAGWQEDAAGRPLGAYYRIEKDVINDLQSAIYEVGAIYVSAQVHAGWDLGTKKKLSVIHREEDIEGGHAFALVGYNNDGFIVQNSWGSEWGYHGFAVLSYADWLKNGFDAWVAVRGVPLKQPNVSSTHMNAGIQSAAEVVEGEAPAARAASLSPTAAQAATVPLTVEKALRHTVVMANNGTPVRRLVDVKGAAAAVEHVCFRWADDWLKDSGCRKVALYAHGGLNDEDTSIRRTQVLGRYFLCNGIYPIFFTWKTGFLDAFGDIIKDQIWGTDPERAALTLPRWIEGLKEAAAEKWDRGVEAASRPVVRPIWTQMKQNAYASSTTGGASQLTAGALAKLKKSFDARVKPKNKREELEIHLVGHSAGSILLGHLLGLFQRRKMKVASCALYAPACTLEFSNRYYRKAIETKTLAKDDLHFDVLSDEREQDDTVGPYRKSLLYLVSRALEDRHKTPLLGMARDWEKPDPKHESRWSTQGVAEVEQWREFWGNSRKTVTVHNEKQVSDGRVKISIAHGSFDNDVAVVSRTLKRITGKNKLDCAVTDLHY